MFTQPLSSPPPGPPPSTSAPSRPSRLRGLSYLRNYTQNHLLSREGHHSGTASSNGGSGSTSPGRQAPAGSGSGSGLGSGLGSGSGTGSGGGLTRSLSYSPTSPRPSNQLNNHNHLTLVSSTPERNPAANPSTNPSTNSSTPGATATAAAAIPDPSPVSAQSVTVEAFDSAADSGAALVPDKSSASLPLPPPVANNSSSSAGDDALDAQLTMTRARAATAGDAAFSSNHSTNANSDSLPSIRFSAYYDPRSTRPSLTFPPISRTLPTGSERIRVGRYSERDSHSMSNMPGNQPSAAPVGFKSKVVSRRHCEFWCEDGKWYIKDVKSSSGTFLNHIRLSPPSQESKAFPVNDGDIVQLGIDFKGGEEMIFRCVKMRLELNRGWQNKLNTFNMAAHKRLQTMAANGTAGSTTSQDCSICLGSIAPCQSLFVAPCSHTWHFKCVRSLLTSPQYPIFICPNCRAGADLEADVDELAEEWQQLRQEESRAEEQDNSESEAAAAAAQPNARDFATNGPRDLHDLDAMDVTVNITPGTPQKGKLPHAVSEPLPIRSPASGAGRSPLRSSRTPSPPGLNGTEGPITPRNDAGPWVFDGSANRRGDGPTAEITSLDAAADMDINQIPSDDSSSR